MKNRAIDRTRPPNERAQDGAGDVGPGPAQTRTGPTTHAQAPPPHVDPRHSEDAYVTDHALTFGLALSLAFTLLYVVLGIIVWRVDPRARLNQAFGLYAVALGAGALLQNLSLVFPDTPVLGGPWGLGTGLGYPLLLLAAFGLWRAGRIYPALPDGAAPSGVFARAGAYAILAAHVAVFVAPALGIITTRPILGLWPVFALGIGVYWVVLFRYALAYGRLDGDASDARQGIALMSGALVVYAAQITITVWANTRLFFDTDLWTPMMAPVLALGLAMPVTLAAVWLNNARGHGARHARNLALLTLASALMALVFWAMKFTAGSGIARGISIAVLTYAILRHQLLDIDMKVRWGVSKSTVAASFIVVFFVASETAQEFFGDIAGSQYIGIIAAGGLLFMLSPLQRFADRFAQRAIPAAPREFATGADASRIYARALRLALKDGRINAKEESQLAALADDLGLGASVTLALRREAEAEVAREPKA